jgi:inosose dehydratase
MTIRWGYSLDQWKPQFDDFVRRRDHERALKTVAVAGFAGIQVSSGTGRWEPTGNPAQIAANFGSVHGLSEVVRACALDGLAAFAVDLGAAYHEDLQGTADPRKAADHDTLLARAVWFADTMAGTGCRILAVRPAPSGAAGAADDDGIASMVAGWNAVGAATAERGVRTVIRFDFLTSLRLDDGWRRLTDAVDPAVVGIAINTGELAAAGTDPLAELSRLGARVEHVVLSNALCEDDSAEFTRPGAEFSVRRSGGQRRVPRWFGELEQPGLVDAEQVVRALVDLDYDGWVIVDTAPSPHPATSALLSGYHVQRVLDPLTRRTT